jgi:hypothetical protein
VFAFRARGPLFPPCPLAYFLRARLIPIRRLPQTPFWRPTPPHPQPHPRLFRLSASQLGCYVDLPMRNADSGRGIAEILDTQRFPGRNRTGRSTAVKLSHFTALRIAFRLTMPYCNQDHFVAVVGLVRELFSNPERCARLQSRRENDVVKSYVNEFRPSPDIERIRLNRFELIDL